MDVSILLLNAATGLWDLSVWQLVAWAALSCHFTLLSVTVYLHRCQAHRSVDLHPALAHAFRFWLWLTTGMNTREWVSVHRKHHARCEGPEDPHSPQVHGIGKVLLEGAELYREAAQDHDMVQQFGHGTPDDLLERRLYSKHRYLGVMSLALVEFLLFGFAGIAVFALQMLCIPVLAAGVINGIGHYWGYRNFETEDAATNIVPFAAVIVGEELHNNHHAYPSSARFALRRWEFDLGWVYLRLFALLGLAKIRRVAPRPVFGVAKERMDLETVKAIVASRLHVMESYARRVTLPVHALEFKAVRGNLSQAQRRRLRRVGRDLVRGESRLDAAGRERLREALETSDVLKTVHEYEERLRAIWLKAGASQEALLQALQQWCQAAEQSGVERLREFALRLRGYELKPYAV